MNENKIEVVETTNGSLYSGTVTSEDAVLDIGEATDLRAIVLEPDQGSSHIEIWIPRDEIANRYPGSGSSDDKVWEES